jgi:hypothetical protein
VVLFVEDADKTNGKGKIVKTRHASPHRVVLVYFQAKGATFPLKAAL